MYDVIQLTMPEENPAKLNGIFQESVDPVEKLFTEAVFVDGKKTVQPLVETVQKIKDELEKQIGEQDSTLKEADDAKKKRSSGEHVKAQPVKYFDPKAFWRNPLFKELEDQLSKIFGFRNVSIFPYIEKYNSREKIFESREMNACVYNMDRYPIEGLVTDKGFYDKTRSVQMSVYITLGLLRALDAEEVIAVLLHEFGHSIDPALVTIKYTETNILTKYMTDRRHAITKAEKKFMEDRKKHGNGFVILFCFTYLLVLLIPAIIHFIKWVHEKLIGKEEAQRRKLEKIKKMVEEDKSKFTRQEYSEAYADNFARMYGFGPQLMRGLHKLSSSMNRDLKSRIKKESRRQEVILNITKNLLQDVHKTDIHRVRALIKEYKDDIADPNIPAKVKEQLKEDLAELEKVLDMYLNNFDEFQNKVNQIINEELQKMEDKDEKKAAKETEKKEDKK